jgi:hypothetical protein
VLRTAESKESGVEISKALSKDASARCALYPTGVRCYTDERDRPSVPRDARRDQNERFAGTVRAAKREGKQDMRRSPIERTAFGALMAVLLFSSILSGEPGRIVRQRLTFMPTAVSVLAEKADSPEKRTRGLMYRKSLGEKEAMIFSFEESARHAFWMRNTRIPLTVIFLDEGLRIVDMQNMSPCLEKTADLCPLYVSRAPARYAVEVNQGFVGKYHIKIGDQVSFGAEE